MVPATVRALEEILRMLEEDDGQLSSLAVEFFPRAGEGYAKKGGHWSCLAKHSQVQTGVETKALEDQRQKDPTR